MRLPIIASLFLFLTALVSVVASQTVPPDSKPVLLGVSDYSMPQSAIDAEIGGTVMIAIRVDDTGKPTDAALISGPMWPCRSTPTSALADLSSTLSEAMMKLRFTPAIQDGKPITKDIGLRVELNNPKIAPQPPVIDPVTGKLRPRQITAGVMNGKAKDLAKPAYPGAARANRDSGAVTIRVLIDEEGKVIRAGAVQGAATLQFAARDAACNSKFAPTTLDGHAVRVSGMITYNFVP